MKLVPMTESEFNFWLPRSRRSYAADKMKANGLAQDEADKVAAEGFNQMLSQGINSKNNFLYSAKDAQQNILGFIWFCVLSIEGHRRAYICDVIIEEQYRGKGYGRQVMMLVEQEIKKQGLNRVGLHVFGFNERAIKLYKSMGYLTTDIEMEKTLPNSRINDSQ